MRCDHCPAPKDESCRGEEVREFCNKVDPTHERYNPEYLRILVRDDVIVEPVLEIPPEVLAEMQREANEWPPPVKPCGGCP